VDWLALFFTLRLGLVSNAGMGIYENHINTDQIVEPVSMFTEMIGEVQIAKTIFIGGSVNTHFRIGRDFLSYYPDETLYGFFAGIRYFPLELRYQHFCGHPVISGIFSGKHKVFSYDQFYVEISNKR